MSYQPGVTHTSITCTNLTDVAPKRAMMINIYEENSLRTKIIFKKLF